eukprot:103326-Prorocentrum_lima.AAC.1
MWCEYGWSVSALRGALEDVCQVLTDMGMEFGLVDYMKILPAWLVPVASSVAVTVTLPLAVAAATGCFPMH